MAKVLQLNYTIRNLKRYAEIIGVLVHYGFEDIVQELRLDRLIERGMTLVGAADRLPEFENLPRRVRVRKALEQLGPTFIKLGQVLSTRPDLVHPEIAEELELLQDNCPQISFEVIKSLLQAELGQRLELFAEIEPAALAAASMAQAHRATLGNGSPVVIKILRPGIRETTEADMEILRALASFAEDHLANLGYSPTEVVNEFARELRKELDMEQEGKATEKLRQMFRSDPGVRFPRVHWEATTSSILTLEEIKGIPLSRLQPEQLPLEERKALVRHGANAVLRQCLEIGFFHADPHPGNLFALPDGVVGFIDCGMTGQIDNRTAASLADLVLAVTTSDLERVLDVVASLADVTQEKLEERGFRADVRDFMQNFENTPLEKLNVGAILREFFEKLRAHHLRCPGDFVLLIKALTTIESVGKRLDPEFDIVAFAHPHVELLVKRNHGPRALKRRLRQSLIQYSELAGELPVEIRHVLAQLRRNRLALNLEHKGLQSLNRSLERAGRSVANATVLAALLIASSILVLASRGDPGSALNVLGIAGFVLFSFLGVIFVLRKGDPGE